jgi:putative sugar O-methyltransferase
MPLGRLLANLGRVLEIGAGYGRLAYLFLSAFPDARYTIADVAPALAVSQNYLAAVFGEGQVARFDPHWTAAAPERAINCLVPIQMQELPDEHVDLAINEGSFDEMPPEVATAYLRDLGRPCRGHVFLTGFAIKAHHGRLGLDELPYPLNWRLLQRSPHAYVPGWSTGSFVLNECQP